MPLIVRVLGAFVVTFVLSRLLIKAGRGVLPANTLILAGHLISFGTLWIFVGVLKAYWVHFLWDAGLIYAVPQLVWLAYDLSRRVPARS